MDYALPSLVVIVGNTPAIVISLSVLFYHVVIIPPGCANIFEATAGKTSCSPGPGEMNNHHKGDMLKKIVLSMDLSDATSEWIWAIIIGIIIVLLVVFVIIPVFCKVIPVPVKGWPDICASFW